MTLDANRLLELAIDDFFRRLPSIIIALASAWIILRRSERRLERHIGKRIGGIEGHVEEVKALVNHRTDQLLEAVEYKGVAKGLEKGAEQAREDRKEVIDALLTPSPMQPVAQQPPPQQPPPEPPPKKEK